MNPTSLLPITDGAAPGFAEPSPAMGFGELIARFILGNGQTSAGDAGVSAEDGGGEAAESTQTETTIPGHRRPDGDVVDTASLLALLPVLPAPGGNTQAPPVDAPDQPVEGHGRPEMLEPDAAAATPAALGTAEARGGGRPGTPTPRAMMPGPAEIPASAMNSNAGPGPAGETASSSRFSPQPTGAADRAVVDEAATVLPSVTPGQVLAPTANSSVQQVAAPGGPSAGVAADRQVATTPETSSIPESGPGPADASGRPHGSRFEPQAGSAAAAPDGEPGPGMAGREAPTTMDASADRARPEPDGPTSASPAPHRTVVEGANGPVPGMRPAATPPPPIDIPPSLVRRVEQAIQMIEHAPPPRRITIDADELNGLRLTVSIRPDGVAVTSPTADTATMDAIEQALRARGFDLSDSGRRRDQRNDAYERDTWRPQPGSGAVPRPRTDQGIRL